MFVLVHGINGGAYHFNGEDKTDPGLRLKQHLEEDLGLKGYVYAYSFDEKCGSSFKSVREFADRNYYTPAG
ncbi:MAG: hypothetical protein NT030_08225, partial [Candidatus Saganbacteria bacterium]|nr:hypothetical protein [Candidatus Saganbacteria bacterium]